MKKEDLLGIINILEQLEGNSEYNNNDLDYYISVLRLEVEHTDSMGDFAKNTAETIALYLYDDKEKLPN